jgi:hypothetical protein
MMQRLGVLFFIAVAGFASYSVSSRNFGVVYVDLGDGRGPAAIRRAYDVSDLDGLALSKKINDRLVGDAKILKKDGAIGLELGQFVTEVGSRKQLACSVYNRVQMVFQAEGEAVSGHAPEMLVEGDCLTADNNVMWMKPIWIPTNEILRSPTSTNDLSFYDQDPVSLKFTYIGDQWPTRWVLTSLRLYHSGKPGGDVIIDRKEVRAASPKSILLEF